MKTAMYPQGPNTDEDGYASEDGTLTMKREYDTRTPNGNPMAGRWVLRRDGHLLDFDRYRHDLAEGNDLDLKGSI